MEPDKTKMINCWFGRGTKMNVKRMRRVLGPKYVRCSDARLKTLREQLYRLADLAIDNFESTEWRDAHFDTGTEAPKGGASKPKDESARSVDGVSPTEVSGKMNPDTR